jgi:hypothetical protein
MRGLLDVLKPAKLHCVGACLCACVHLLWLGRYMRQGDEDEEGEASKGAVSSGHRSRTGSGADSVYTDITLASLQVGEGGALFGFFSLCILPACVSLLIRPKASTHVLCSMFRRSKQGFSQF